MPGFPKNVSHLVDDASYSEEASVFYSMRSLENNVMHRFTILWASGNYALLKAFETYESSLKTSPNLSCFLCVKPGVVDCSNPEYKSSYELPVIQSGSASAVNALRSEMLYSLMEGLLSSYAATRVKARNGIFPLRNDYRSFVVGWNKMYMSNFLDKAWRWHFAPFLDIYKSIGEQVRYGMYIRDDYDYVRDEREMQFFNCASYSAAVISCECFYEDILNTSRISLQMVKTLLSHTGDNLTNFKNEMDRLREKLDYLFNECENRKSILKGFQVERVKKFPMCECFSNKDKRDIFTVFEAKEKEAKKVISNPSLSESTSIVSRNESVQRPNRTSTDFKSKATGGSTPVLGLPALSQGFAFGQPLTFADKLLIVSDSILNFIWNVCCLIAEPTVQLLKLDRLYAIARGRLVDDSS
ncbi:hypothetical protein PAEPH01_1008 [Pancytospora epiphaga]|nr:hypothetical protein PAEPH01_1008 [Pancytospora epiphaga]